MTNESLAQSYLRKASDRFDVLLAFIPMEEYSLEDARTAQQGAQRVLQAAKRVIEGSLEKSSGAERAK